MHAYAKGAVGVDAGRLGSHVRISSDRYAGQACISSGVLIFPRVGPTQDMRARLAYLGRGLKICGPGLHILEVDLLSAETMRAGRRILRNRDALKNFIGMHTNSNFD